MSLQKQQYISIICVSSIRYECGGEKHKLSIKGQLQVKYQYTKEFLNNVRINASCPTLSLNRTFSEEHDPYVNHAFSLVHTKLSLAEVSVCDFSLDWADLFDIRSTMPLKHGCQENSPVQ